MRLGILDSGHGFGTKVCSRSFVRSRGSRCSTSSNWSSIAPTSTAGRAASRTRRCADLPPGRSAIAS